jgi:glycerophosphoryl diester phosphodiesterase
MRRTRTWMTAPLAMLLAVPVIVAALASASSAQPGNANGPKPAKNATLVIGHRGASGYRPEHTLASYKLAIEQCADFIEPDLVSTKDGVLVARHEDFINQTTDVASHPEFAYKQTTKTIDGVVLTGWFTEDFTLAELKTLRAVERLPSVRPQNAAYDGLFEIPTLQEVIDLARASRTCDGHVVGIYPETKHPSYFDSIGLSLEEPLVATLNANGYRGPRAPVYIQSFEVSNLQQLDTMTQVPLVQLLDCTGKPWDFAVTGDPRSYATLATPAGLDFISTYADGIGACKNLLIPRDAAGNLTSPSPVIADAHTRGLLVHGWTFRRENQFLPTSFQIGADPNAYGDLQGEITAFLTAGMDGFFTDQPDVGVAAVEAWE